MFAGLRYGIFIYSKKIISTVFGMFSYFMREKIVTLVLIFENKKVNSSNC